MSQPANSPPTQKIDKETLYGEWIKGERARQNMNRRAVEKAMDLPPEDDVQITNTTTGITLKHLLGIAAIVAAAGGIGLLAVLGMSGIQDGQQQITPPVVNMEPIDLRINWWVEDGESQAEVKEVAE